LDAGLHDVLNSDNTSLGEQTCDPHETPDPGTRDARAGPAIPDPMVRDAGKNSTQQDAVRQEPVGRRAELIDRNGGNGDHR